ncbi:MAG: phosphatase PAP2 family protein [Dehalococcoidia bacterium]
MSAGATTYSGGFARDLSRYATPALAALKIIYRAALAALAVWLLASIRSGSSPEVYALTYAISLIAVYMALDGTSFRVWALYVTGFILFAQLRGHADGMGMPVQFDYPVAMEKALFFGTIPSIWLQDQFYTFARLGPLETYTIGVYLAYFFAPHALAFALWRFDNDRFKTYAFSFMLTLYLGLLTAALLPTAPPWMAGQLGHIPHVYQVLPDVSGEVAPGAYQNVYQIAGANNVAAMPSLHAAIPFLMAIALWKYRWLRWAGAAFAVSMLFSIVYLGEHYAVDGLAGWAVAGAAWAGVTAFRAKREASAAIRAAQDTIVGSPAPSPELASSARER